MWPVIFNAKKCFKKILCEAIDKLSKRLAVFSNKNETSEELIF